MSEFSIKMLIVFAASSAILWFMNREQKKREAKADASFRNTMKMLEVKALKDKEAEKKAKKSPRKKANGRKSSKITD
jgi:hypothetical protein